MTTHSESPTWPYSDPSFARGWSRASVGDDHVTGEEEGPKKAWMPGAFWAAVVACAAEIAAAVESPGNSSHRAPDPAAPLNGAPLGSSNESTVVPAGVGSGVGGSVVSGADPLDDPAQDASGVADIEARDLVVPALEPCA